jgi:hypothetical protein
MAWVNEIIGDFAFVDLFAKYTEIVGLTIKEVVMAGTEGDQLAIHFTDGRILIIGDGGASCCESRYMTCDDDLSGHEGGNLLSIDMDAAGGPPENEGDSESYHEQQFVKVQTTKGSFTLCTHNIHNGYYGGFSLTAELHR